MAVTQETPRVRGEEEGIHPYWQEAIEGRYRQISAQQLALYWWLYAQHTITARQLRTVFACHEMDERRAYLEAGAHRLYGLPELQRLIGGGGGVSDSALKSDLRALTRLGVLTIEPKRIGFAVTVDQLSGDLDLAGFWEFFGAMPHPKRTIPVPRRLLRALAGGFSRAVTGTLIAHLIRSLFWHKKAKGYRVDGRTKASWIVEHFGISRRAVIDARQRLVELGWLEKLPAEQWEINRWGGRYALRTAGPVVEFEAQSAPPREAIAPESAPPYKQISSPKGEALETRRPTFGGASGLSGRKDSGGRKKKPQAPTVIDMQRVDLDDPARTQELYRDACTRGKARASEHGRLQFFALVERARAHGQDPCRLLAWLLRDGKASYISQSDEDCAVERIKRLDFGGRPPDRRELRRTLTPTFVAGPPEDVRYYMAVHDAVERSGTQLSAAAVAREHLGWDRARWDQAEAEWWKWQQEKAEAVALPGGV
ncbi:MAG: hypothetical protein AB7N24_22475 [Dehalococcoidia bacterium]